MKILIDDDTLKKITQKLTQSLTRVEEQYREIKPSIPIFYFSGHGGAGKTTLTNMLFSKTRLTIVPDLPGFNYCVDNVNDDKGLKNLWNTYSQVKNLRTETQNIDKDINAFLESTKDYLENPKTDIFSPSLIILNCCSDNSSTNYNNNPFGLDVGISLILEIQERNKKLLAKLTKLEATLQAVMLMLLVTSAKQIPSFTVYLICHLNMNVIEWLSSGFGEEMMGDLTERHHEIKDEHPNSDILVSFILLATALQMLWSFLLIKLDDSISNEEIKSYFVGMPYPLAYS